MIYRFLNISNHPSDKWPKEQVDEVRKIVNAMFDNPIADRKIGIVDIPFPQIPPDADTQAVTDIVTTAWELVHDKCGTIIGVMGAMVQGEMTAVVAFLKILQQCLIPAYAATGEVAGFRAYPALVGNGNGTPQCPGCNSTRTKPVRNQVHECLVCGGIFGICSPREYREYVSPEWHQGPCDLKDRQYFDFEIRDRSHGWMHRQTRKIVQIG
ncbi:MAG TPA: hypothetical protein PLY86_20100 [bacterium]|nr:hypothetical protein [bacterium]